MSSSSSSMKTAVYWLPLVAFSVCFVWYSLVHSVGPPRPDPASLFNVGPHFPVHFCLLVSGAVCLAFYAALHLHPEMKTWALLGLALLLAVGLGVLLFFASNGSLFEQVNPYVAVLRRMSKPVWVRSKSLVDAERAWGSKEPTVDSLLSRDAAAFVGAASSKMFIGKTRQNVIELVGALSTPTPYPVYRSTRQERLVGLFYEKPEGYKLTTPPESDETANGYSRPWFLVFEFDATAHVVGTRFEVVYDPYDGYYKWNF